MSDRMNLPDPLLPPDVDLRTFRYMPLHIDRLRNSDFWIEAVEDYPLVAAVSVNLWTASWHQVPAGSLPDSDLQLAKAAGVSRTKWHEIKDRALAPWTLCSDGRYYHPGVVRAALEAWAERMKHRAKMEERSRQQAAKSDARWKKEQELKRADAIAYLRQSYGYAGQMPLKGEGEGEVEDEKKMRDKSLLSPSDSDAPDEPMYPASAKGIERYSEEFLAWWHFYPRKDHKSRAYRAFLEAKRRTTVPIMMIAAEAYARRTAKEDQQFKKLASSWLNGDCWNDEPS